MFLTTQESVQINKGIFILSWMQRANKKGIVRGTGYFSIMEDKRPSKGEGMRLRMLKMPKYGKERDEII